MLKSKTVSISIDCDPETAYEFVANLENLPRWARGLGSSVKQANGEWVAETPQGPAKIRLARRNDLGILDHYVSLSPGVEVFVPMRVVPNGRGSEVISTVFQQAGMTDEKHAEDVRLVKRDLENLKDVIENS